MNSRFKQFFAKKLIPFLQGQHKVPIKDHHLGIHKSKQPKLNENNIINGQFRVLMPIDKCIKILDKNYKSIIKQEAKSKRLDVESERLLNQVRTGYSNPIQTGLNLKNNKH